MPGGEFVAAVGGAEPPRGSVEVEADAVGSVHRHQTDGVGGHGRELAEASVFEPQEGVGVVLAQAAWSVGLALTAAVGAAVAFGALVERVAPAVAIAVEPPRVVRLAVVGLVIGVLGALVPLRRVVTVDPASAFRRAA
jgi:hypothetical protein